MHIGLFHAAMTRFRPLGKSVYVSAPWCRDHAQDAFAPSVMSVPALKTAVVKSMEMKHDLNERIVERVQAHIIAELRSIWIDSPDDMLMTYEEAIDDLTLEKSPGFPYYFSCDTKAEALLLQGDVIKEKVYDILSGKEVVCVFAGTEKSELRPMEKVSKGLTRLFCASDLHHLLSSKILYEKQNKRLIDTVGKHPITIGIQIPGPQFARALMGLSKTADGMLNDGDMSGCDLRYNLRAARAVRDIRHAFLPGKYRKAGIRLYNAVYCGFMAMLGNIWIMYGNKSGWNNTGMDNSLMLWFVLVYAIFSICGDVNPIDIMSFLINGDDLVTAQNSQVLFKDICDFLRVLNVHIDADDWLPRNIYSVVYLSHHLEHRYVPYFGDFVVAAGNIHKLRASVNWVKPNKSLTFEESCVAHLVGVRMCLFPWAIDFEEVDELLSDYLKTIEITSFIRQCLKARFSDIELARLHTKREFSFFDSIKGVAPYEVLKVLGRLIKVDSDAGINHV